MKAIVFLKNNQAIAGKINFHDLKINSNSSFDIQDMTFRVNQTKLIVLKSESTKNYLFIWNNKIYSSKDISEFNKQWNVFN